MSVLKRFARACAVTMAACAAAAPLHAAQLATAPEKIVTETNRAVVSHCCAVIELRQYTLKPGRRDTLI